MSEDASGPSSDESIDDEADPSSGSEPARDPFEETFVVKETEPVEPRAPAEDRAVDDRSQPGARREDEWGRIPMDLSGGDDVSEPDDSEPEDDPYAPEPNSAPVVPENPSLESAIFVLLGAIAMVLVLVRLVSVTFV